VREQEVEQATERVRCARRTGVDPVIRAPPVHRGEGSPHRRGDRHPARSASTAISIRSFEAGCLGRRVVATADAPSRDRAFALDTARRHQWSARRTARHLRRHEEPATKRAAHAISDSNIKVGRRQRSTGSSDPGHRPASWAGHRHGRGDLASPYSGEQARAKITSAWRRCQPARDGWRRMARPSSS